MPGRLVSFTTSAQNQRMEDFFVDVMSYDDNNPPVYAEATLAAMQQKAFSVDDPIELRRVALIRPIARIWMSARIERIKDASLKAAFTLHIWGRQRAERLPLLCACTFCGMPTGSWCDAPKVGGYCGRAVCTCCDELYKGCPLHYSGTRDFGVEGLSPRRHVYE